MVHKINYFIILMGIIVMIAWVIGFKPVLSFLPNSVTMKFPTALMFTLIGVGYEIRLRHNSIEADVAKVVCGLSVHTILFFTAFFFAMHRSFEVFTPDTNVYTPIAGIPSSGTFIAFFMLALPLIFQTQYIRKGACLLSSTIGTVAFIGYLTHSPALYYYYESVSTAMAFHTALGFIALGIFNYKEIEDGRE